MPPFDSKAFLLSVTHQPGVYRMYNAEAEVIYVGKAKDLKKRLSSYFRSNIPSEKTKALVTHIAQIDVTVTHTETEALILEHNYIKQYLPKYNVLLRDDKSYPYIFIRIISIQGSPFIVVRNEKKENILDLILIQERLEIPFI